MANKTMKRYSTSLIMRNANQNHEISLHIHYYGSYQKTQNVKTWDMQLKRLNPNVDYELQFIEMHQYWLTNVTDSNKCATLTQDAEETAYWRREGGVMESPVLSSQVFLKLQLL